MKKFKLAILLGLSLSFSASYAVDKVNKSITSITYSKSQDDPNYVTGALNYYAADRDPTASEPTINTGYFNAIQILWWKNTSTGDVWLLKDAVDNGDGTFSLTWVMISVTSN